MKSKQPSSPFELRVLDGEQRGARTAFGAGKTLTVSAGWDSDIVLRGADVGERRLTLKTHSTGVHVHVLQGDASVGGRTLRAGEEYDLPLYTPLHLGGTVFAVGRSGLEAWPGVDPAEDGSSPAIEPAESELPQQTEAIGKKLISGSSAASWSNWLLLAGGSLAAVSMGVLTFVYAVTPSPPTARQQAQRVETALKTAGFPGLTVSSAPGGELVVSGYLDTSAQRARVERVLANQPLSARLAVWVNANVSAAVLDVFRVNGINAQVESAGPGSVTVSTQVADQARLEQLMAIARRDVPGLGLLEVRNSPPGPVPDPAPVISDPGKRLSSIVPGDPAYVVTADGTRYFEGAMLPTGHRIAAIHEREVLLERSGTMTPLRF